MLPFGSIHNPQTADWSYPLLAYITVVFRLIHHQSARNENVFTEIVGNVSTKDNRNYYALSTLDGKLLIYVVNVFSH